MTLDVHTLNQALLAGCGVLLVAILAVRGSVRVGLPSLLLYLLIGVGLGDAGLGVEFSDAQLANALGFAALVVILAEGGLTTSWHEMRPVVRLGASLATLGVAVSVGVMAVVAHFAFGMSWELAVLLGAVTSPTDAAAVFSVLRKVPLPRRLNSTLEAESGLNDAPTVVLVTLVSAGGHHGVLGFVGEVALELVVGLVVGVAVGFAGAWLMRRAALPASGLYPLAVLSLSVFAYASSAMLHGSGFASVYVAALILGNSELPHRAATRSFAEGMAWLAQIGLFVMLGLLVTPGRITWEHLGLAVAAGLVLTYVARPLSVLVSAVVQPMPWRELGFISWAGLRGAVPIVLATIPLSEGVDDATRLFDIVFVMVVIYTVLTAPTLPLVARVLKVARRSEPRELEVEAAPLERIAADLLMVTISPKSLMHGVEVGELRLPVGASVSLVVRDERTFVPQLRTVLRHGDELLVVTPRRLRDKTEQRLRAVSLGGRLAQWLGSDPAAPRRD
jgi:cell volume regulation protein A